MMVHVSQVSRTHLVGTMDPFNSLLFFFVFVDQTLQPLLATAS